MLSKKEVKKIRNRIHANEQRLPMIFSALSDSGRFRIIELLIWHRGICVTDIASIFKVSVPAVSQQLRVLEMIGIVQKERMGKMICYKIKKNDPVVKCIIDVIKDMRKKSRER